MSAAADRLGRVLNLVPYLLARPGIRIDDAAADLGVSPAELRDDLQLLWVCGLPGYGPGDLIDMSLDGDTVTITYDAGIDRPLRLTPDEGLALMVALRTLAETPGLAQRDAVERALAKIEAATGEAADSVGRVAVRGPYAGDRAAEIRGALDRGRALRIRYYTAGRDATTDRVVDPMRLLTAGAWTYLEAWCRHADAVRLFRLDRIDELTELAEPAAPPPQARPADLRSGPFRPTPDQPLVTLRIDRGARWITEYYPCEAVRHEPDGRWRVSLRASDLSWARRLVLGLGPDVEVVGPPELVSAVAEDARAALAAYGIAPDD
ncbi:helix-turn-helix transcriptional regulator [Actinocatenispora rupis]|uniref:Protein pafC n=1 Tax=Actinocatenispora rupis TaxID=519421 RepID=A0A8J3N9H8_9ACTN|nr:WYL domain-containing protein [Actinocatenispora rupis]GID11121.1 protein pafC [Actinocatenispora rupis]